MLIVTIISAWQGLGLVDSLLIGLIAYAVVGWLWCSAWLLNRLLAPKRVEYEAVVLADSGWTEAADEPELD